MKDNYYKSEIDTIDKLKNDLKTYCKQNELLVQELEDPEKGWVFQMRKDSKITLGIASRALTVIITKYDHDLTKVTVGEAKWISKISGGLFSFLSGGILGSVLLPVSISSAFKQRTMIKDIERLIKQRLVQEY